MSLIKGSVLILPVIDQLVVFAYTAGGWDSFPSEGVCFNPHIYNGIGGCKISFILLLFSFIYSG
jgi:hypothetical protein